MQDACAFSTTCDKSGSWNRFSAQGIEDIEHDDTVGFQVITTDDIDDYGIKKVIEKIRQRIGDKPVYLRYVKA